MPPKPKRRDPRLSALGEVRAVFEVAAYYTWRPALTTLAPAGDGHPVLILPGFMSTDSSTSPLRAFLGRLGYETHGWEYGRNTGFTDALFERLAARTEAIAQAGDTTVSVVGHSLGGIYARLLAHEVPAAVRQVVLLGTAFNVTRERHVATPVSKFYERLNPFETTSERLTGGLVRRTPEVPSTTIYSEGDGIVAWRDCIDNVADHTESLRVRGTHVGMPYNPAVLYAIADRLAQPEGEWRPFDAGRGCGLVYGTPDGAGDGSS